MIRAQFYRNPSGKIWGFEIRGHAGYEESGKDIICAAVSALSINTVNSIEALANEKPIVSEKDGMLSVEIASLRKGKENSSASLLLNALLLGLNSINADYGSSYLTVSSNYKA